MDFCLLVIKCFRVIFDLVLRVGESECVSMRRSYYTKGSEKDGFGLFSLFWISSS